MASILQTPHIDPVPPYAPRTGDTSRERDSDAASVLSLAPSYHSTATELPTYDSIRPLGLPPVTYAPGFTPASSDPISAANYTNSSSVQRTNPARRQYENVANRRVQQGEMMANLLATISNMPTPLGLLPVVEESVESGDVSQHDGNERTQENEGAQVGQVQSNTVPQGAGAQTASSNRNMLLGYCPYIAPPASFNSTSSSPPTSPGAVNPNAPKPLPCNPHEDPELVGHAAAERAKAQRLYRETIRRDMAAQALRQKLEEESLLNDNMMGLFSTVGYKQQTDWSLFRSHINRGSRPRLGRQTHFRRWSSS